MLALAGLPGTAGFIGKLFLIEATVEAGYTWLGVAIVIGTMVSMAYYLRVLAAVWIRRRRAGAPAEPRPAIAGGSPEADAEVPEAACCGAVVGLHLPRRGGHRGLRVCPAAGRLGDGRRRIDRRPDERLAAETGTCRLAIWPERSVSTSSSRGRVDRRLAVEPHTVAEQDRREVDDEVVHQAGLHALAVGVRAEDLQVATARGSEGDLDGLA